jgi:uncharacterized membrane protein
VFRVMMQRQMLALVLILLLAAAGRILNIDQESLWVDEGFSYWAIRHDDMLNIIINDVHPPLYFFGLRLWEGVTGLSELALRYFSVLPSLLSVGMMVPLMREFGRLRGTDAPTWLPVTGALLLALADMEIYISQQVRMYSWHVLWIIVSMTLFLRWLRLHKDRTLILWGGANVLLLYTQYIGLASIAVQGMAVLLFQRGRTRIKGVVMLALVGVAFIPWMLVVVSGQTDNIGTGFNVPSTLASLWDWREEWFTGQWALMIGLAVAGLVVVRGERVRPHWASAFILAGWLILPVAGAYVLNFYTPILMDYRLTQITPAVVALIALGLVNIPQTTRGFLVIVILVYGVAIYDTPRPRPPWQAVGQNAALYAQPDDLALAHITPSGDWHMMYYYERFMPALERRSLRQWQLEDGETYAAGLPALTAQYSTVWFMHWSSDRSGFEALATTGHVQTTIMTEDWLGNDLNVYRFDQVPPEADAVAVYESGLTLRVADFDHDDLRVDLLWSTPQPLTADYTISAIVLDASGRLVAQDDRMPFRGERPTTGFAPGEVVYDPHELTLVEGITALPPGEYTIGVKTYTFTDVGLVVIPTQDGKEFAVVEAFTVAG